MLAITGGRLFDGTHAAAIEPATVLVDGARIKAVGPRASVPVPEGAEIIDARGATVMPGLIDMHVHTALGAGQDGLYLWLANGVTTVRDLGGDPDQTLAMRDEVNAGTRVGPRIFAVGPWIQGDSGQEMAAGSPMWVHRDRADARRSVEALLARGVDGFKLYTMLRPDLLSEIVRVIDGRAWTTAHIARTKASEAVAAGVECIEHVHASLYQDVVLSADRHGPDGGPGITPDYWRWLGHGWARADLKAEHVKRLVEGMAASTTALSPTMVMITGGWITDEAAADPGTKYEPRALRERRARQREQMRTGPESQPLPQAGALSPEEVRAARDHQLELLRMLYDAGCTILPSTDSPAVPFQVPGFSLHRELALHAEAGIPNSAILQSATRVAALKLRKGRDLGTIEAGKIADIIVVEGDPLADIHATRAVRVTVKDGVAYDPSELLKKLE